MDIFCYYFMICYVTVKKSVVEIIVVLSLGFLWIKLVVGLEVNYFVEVFFIFIHQTVYSKYLN